MPILGHAAAGLATAALLERPRRRPSGSPLVVPLCVALAYVPDIVSQLMALAGQPAGRLAAHSFLFALGCGAIVALAPIRALGTTYLRRFAIAAGSIALHDVLDLWQASDRMPLWPFSHASFNTGVHDSMRLRTEVLVFAPFAALAIWQLARARAGSVQRPPGRTRASLMAWTLVAAIAALAAAVHVVRDRRERDVEIGRELLEKGAFAEAIEAVRTADRWPSTARPGRADYVRAEASLGLGRCRDAETLYERAYEADPDYFWGVADLAAFYASSDRPADERDRKLSPLVRRLETEFVDEPARPAALARIREHLGRPARCAGTPASP